MDDSALDPQQLVDMYFDFAIGDAQLQFAAAANHNRAIRILEGSGLDNIANRRPLDITSGRSTSIIFAVDTQTGRLQFRDLLGISL